MPRSEGRSRRVATFPLLALGLTLVLAAPAAALTVPTVPPVPTTVPAVSRPPVHVDLSSPAPLPSLPPVSVAAVTLPGPGPVAPATTTPPAGVAPSPAPRATAAASVGPGSRPVAAARPPAGPAVTPPVSRPAPPAVADPARRLRMDRLERAVSTAARDFSFPLGLALAVALFLVVQGRLDARDPKLARAAVSEDDDMVAFR